MALGKVLLLSGPQFPCEVHALHPRLGLLSLSPNKLQVCRPAPGVAQRDLRLWPRRGWGAAGRVLLGEPDVIKCESLGSCWGICSCDPDCKLWAWDLDELMFPHP